MQNETLNPSTTEGDACAEPSRPKFVIGVRLRGRDKTQVCDPHTLQLRVGMEVMVETEDGLQIGVVASNKILNVRKDACRPPKVIRLANQEDLQHEQNKCERESKATVMCRDLIVNLKLPMNLSRVVFFEELNKSVFYFTAEGRIDFRQLVKELASRLRHRIEMRQVGVRDEAKSINGHGVCGEELCCSRFLPEFTPVTIRMAKDQGLALNPSKISGVCGRLMCCLQYEHNIYKDLIKEMPKLGKTISTPDGKGRVIQNDILKQKVTVRLEDDFIMYYDLEELREHLPPQAVQPPKPAS
ncbi:Stage 0 sporulation protein yaaT [Nitrospina gracilis 3/211]|uniref:Stage 0 sporulation protein yaaT n=1 Tax=Nitrospina gracilis (strain 3/211) TaxID=1266370 RepID=M1ZE75_NITG3|nr:MULTISPECIES: regulatory iron-sulfur-containing complex subunit RicT [Nitrospina]MCF8724666.1 cell fate regulator YaaT (PSP1 superfamily) [Nitrospina sp. Nb-3]CCQ91849.1 Stage 0 sporulation protein yaaT [Nitrospina gracilis 3/211]